MNTSRVSRLVVIALFVIAVLIILEGHRGVRSNDETHREANG